MTAVYINCLAVIIGSIIGMIFSKKITEQMSSVISTGAGAVTLVLGIQMAFKYQNIIFLVISVIAGGLIGNKIDIDGKIYQFGAFLEKKLYHAKVAETHSSKPSFAFAFLNSSVLFCVGAMAILGSLKAGIEGDYSIIMTKSVLDGFLAVVFGASMGVGTAFSALSIFIYQGALTVASSFIAPYVSSVMIDELSASGGVLILMIGINLLGLKKIKTANFLPAVLLTAVFVLADGLRV